MIASQATRSDSRPTLHLSALASCGEPAGEAQFGCLEQGQAAVEVGSGPLAARPDQRPAPIASVATVTTGYVTLEHYALGPAQDGFTTTVTEPGTGFDTPGQSAAALRAGEQLTERHCSRRC